MDKPIAITLAGHDPSGGAGAAADALTFAALGCFPAAVVTAITYQNTQGVSGFKALNPDGVEKQLIAVMNDYRVSAAKLGMLASRDIVSALAPYLSAYAAADVPVVCDTVFASGGGVPLFDGDAVGTYGKHVIKYCSLITPNIPEAELLAGGTGENALTTAKKLFGLSGVPVLLKGGHGSGDTVTDIFFDARGATEFSRTRLGTEIHGTGCLLSAAVTAFLAKGYPLREAVSAAENYVSAALENRLKPGKGKAVPDRVAAGTLAAGGAKRTV
jgi:hydroxymethylpyrimidine kinase/phosphomethylpyrimidine kinase